jgi:N-acetylmuramoyl-L-alanine amidase
MKVSQHRLHDDQGSPVPFRESPNHGGALEPRYLIIHYTAGRSAEGAASWLCNPKAKAAAHLVIGRDGSIVQLVPFDVVAWHAGASAWQDGGKRIVGLNRHSIGIELDNPGRLTRRGDRWRSLALGTEYADADVIEATHKNERRPSGWHVYPAEQLDVLFEVCAALAEQYSLRDVMGHDDIAPGRKADPGPAFPMESLRTRLFGRADDGEPDRFVTTTELNVRIGPGTEHACVIVKPLPVGARVEVLSVEGSWRRVDVLDAIDDARDIQGWVHGRYLRADGD